MTAKNKRRATSTLSPVPDMLQSPVSNIMTPKSKMAASKLGQDREETRTAINKRLQNDRSAILAARKAATSDPNWSTMNMRRQEKMQQSAALTKIQQRKDGGIHVSSYYPIFKDYIPHVAYGRAIRKDDERDALISRHLDSLNDASAQIQSEEGDDEELDVWTNKKENDDVRDLKDIAPYTKGREAEPTKRGKTGKEGAGDDDEDSDTSDSGAADGDGDEEISEAESELSELNSEEGGDEDEDDEDQDQDDRATFVAVSRGRPLPSDMPLPAKSYVNRKQHFATGIKCIEQAVVRGQIPRDDGKGQKLDDSVEDKDSTSKKRACEDGEKGGRALRKTRKVKVEVNA